MRPRIYRLTRFTFLCIDPKGFFFRICDKGLSFSLDAPVLFSERYGYRKVLRIGRLAIEVLR